MASLSHIISASPPTPTFLRLPLLREPRFKPFVISPKPIAFTGRGLGSFGVSYRRNVGLGFACNAVEREDWMGDSSIPDQMKHLAKEAPDPPNKWLLFSGFALLLYTWRAILWELSKYESVLLPVVNIILDPIKLLLRIPMLLLSAIYTFVVYTFQTICFYTPVPELTRVIFFSSIVLSIGGAVSTDSIDSQKHLLSLAGIVSFLTVCGYVPEVLFWVFLSGLFSYSFFVRQTDVVLAGLTPATALAAIGEPWVRGFVIILYLVVAIMQYFKYTEVERAKVRGKMVMTPLPLQVAALSIGISMAAAWARHRHLLWMAMAS
ncbi:Embryo defective 1923 [Rhynchospora pubera]|uniref:Embryo defective 1923 n=1 Tax=Rhynchospora pubera TaxID=906938 RepID=A0AAV8FGS8_9POAL|nr:Embryo defective 1923 [Rhynchospora pubera]